MDEDECDLAENLDCPSLLCEELEDEETKDKRGCASGDEVGELLVKLSKDERIGTEQQQQQVESAQENGHEAEQVEVKASEAEEETWTLQLNKCSRRRSSKKDKRRKNAHERDDRRSGRKKRSKKHGDKVRKKRSSKDAHSEQLEEKTVSQTQIVAVAEEEDVHEEEKLQQQQQQAAAVSESPFVELTNSCDLSDPIFVDCGGAGQYGSTLPGPLLYSSQSLVPIQPGPPGPGPDTAPAPPPPHAAALASQLHGTKRPHSPALPCGLPQPAFQPLEMEITQVYSTRRSIRYSTRGQGQALSFSLVPALEPVDGCLLPPAPKKKARTLYSTDQLEHLEALFHEDHYPDAEKRKVIATSVGVTPQRIMVWFQNRRAKWRKAERSLTAKVEAKQSRTRWNISPQHNFNPSLASSQGAPPAFPAHFASKLPPLPSAAPSFSTLPSQTLTSYSNLLASIDSPGQSRMRDGAQYQLPPQGSLAESHPRPMYSPPPLRRASLPVYPPPASNLAPPLLSTPPLFLDTLEGGTAVGVSSSSSSSSSLPPLQTDASSLFDYMTSSQQSSSGTSHPFQLQGASYPGSQAQHPMAYLTPSPYLTPNAPDSNPASYLTLCPGGSSAGMMAYSSASHAYYQPQNTGQVQPAPHHGGLPAYQSYPWTNVYSQPSLHQHTQCPPVFPAGLANAQSSSSASLPSFFALGEHGPSHTNPQRPTQTLTQTTSSSTCSSSVPAAATATVLPPVSTLQPSHLRAHNTPTKAASQLPPQVTPASPDSPTVTPCVKMENDSPQEIHSHFHCDFSPINF